MQTSCGHTRPLCLFLTVSLRSLLLKALSCAMLLRQMWLTATGFHLKLNYPDDVSRMKIRWVCTWDADVTDDLTRTSCHGLNYRHYWLLVQGYQGLVDSPHKGPALWSFGVLLIFSLNTLLEKQQQRNTLKNKTNKWSTYLGPQL